MKFTDNTKTDTHVEFSTLKSGDAFKYETAFYLKVYGQLTPHNAIVLSARYAYTPGRMASFTLHTKVIPVDLEMIVTAKQ